MQVVAPISGKVVFVGELEEKGHVIILKQSKFFVIIKGVGVPICELGENMMAGEPIGKSSLLQNPSSEVLTSAHDITLELRKGEIILDPSPYIKQGENNATA